MIILNSQLQSHLQNANQLEDNESISSSSNGINTGSTEDERKNTKQRDQQEQQRNGTHGKNGSSCRISNLNDEEEDGGCNCKYKYCEEGQHTSIDIDMPREKDYSYWYCQPSSILTRTKNNVMVVLRGNQERSAPLYLYILIIVYSLIALSLGYSMGKSSNFTLITAAETQCTAAMNISSNKLKLKFKFNPVICAWGVVLVIFIGLGLYADNLYRQTIKLCTRTRTCSIQVQVIQTETPVSILQQDSPNFSPSSNDKYTHKYEPASSSSSSSSLDLWRHQIMATLGSIHAPPPSISTPIVPGRVPVPVPVPVPKELQNQFVLLAENHALLLYTTEKAIHALRMVSSIQFGLGPVSPSLERVERKLIHRSSGAVSGNGAGNGAGMNMHRMRRVLMHSLKEQYRDLKKIMEKQEQLSLASSEKRRRIILNHNSLEKDNYDIDKDFDIDMDDDEYVFAEGETACIYDEMGTEIYTIAMLKSCIMENKEILSKVLSAALVNHESQMRCLPVEDNGYCYCHWQSLTCCLDYSCRFAEELEVYTRSYFNLDNPSDGDLANAKKNAYIHMTVEEGKYLAELQKQVTAIQVTFWAFAKGLTNRREEGEDIDTNTGMVTMDGETRGLWDSLACSLHNALEVHQCFEATLLPDVDSFFDKKACDNGGLNGNNGNNKVQEVHEYDDEGKPIGLTQIQTIQDPRWSNKTLIFRGKGSKLSRRTKETMRSQRPTKAIPTLFHESSGRLILLKELQSRLNSIAFPEEMEVDSLSHDPDNEDCAPGAIAVVKKGEKTTNFFMGVTGDLLSELKGAMISCESEGDMHIIGD